MRCGAACRQGLRTQHSMRMNFLLSAPSLLPITVQCSWHSFAASMNSQTPTARLVKIIGRNEMVHVSNVIKPNGEFTKSPLETLNYLLDILSPGSQQTENHGTRYDLVDNPFMRPEDTKIIANICSFEHMEAAINEFQPFKAPGPDGLYPVLLQKG